MVFLRNNGSLFRNETELLTVDFACMDTQHSLGSQRDLLGSSMNFTFVSPTPYFTKLGPELFLVTRKNGGKVRPRE